MDGALGDGRRLNGQGGSFVARPKVSSGKTSGRRVRDPEGARRALLENAVELFERNGYAATSVQSIVDAAELTKGAFYHHFESKEDLLYRVHDEFINYQLGRARSVMADKEQSPDQILRRLITERYSNRCRSTSRDHGVHAGTEVPAHRCLREIQQKRDEFERFFVDVIERGMQEGVFRQKGPARLVAFGIIGMGAWTHVWLDLKGSVTPREIGTIYADILIDGLIERPADA